MVAIVEPRSVAISDEITLSVHEQGSGFPVVLCHGFPELAFSWRYQLPAIAEAGFRAIAPDQRGYGRSTVPKNVEDYGLGKLTGDLVGLLDALEIEKAVFVGHDWGGIVSWAMPVLHPDRVAGAVGVCTPYWQMPRTSLMLESVGGDDERLYITWFQRREEPEKKMDPYARELFVAMMRAASDPAELLAARAAGEIAMNPFIDLPDLEGGTTLPMVTPAELDHYVEAFTRTGFFGGISWYRNIDSNADTFPEFGTQKLDLPCLQIGAEWDGALPPSLADPMGELCRDLEVSVIPRAGHWVQQEYPVQLNAILIDWLKRRFG